MFTVLISKSQLIFFQDLAFYWSNYTYMCSISITIWRNSVFVITELIPIGRGGHRLCDEKNYSFRIYKKIKEVTYWKCIEDCSRARVHTRDEKPLKIIRALDNQSHTSNPSEPNKNSWINFLAAKIPSRELSWRRNIRRRTVQRLNIPWRNVRQRNFQSLSYPTHPNTR